MIYIALGLVVACQKNEADHSQDQLSSNAVVVNDQTQNVSSNSAQPRLLFLDVNPPNSHELAIFEISIGSEGQFIHAGEFLGGKPLSPDKQSLVIVHEDIYYILNIQTKALEKINLNGDPYKVFWSPDGLSFAYLLHDLTTKRFSIELYSIEDKKVTTLTELSTIWGELYGWSWNSRLLAVAWFDEKRQQYDLYTIDVEDQIVTQITDNEEIEAIVEWSPNSEEILVGTMPQKYQYYLYVDGPLKISDFKLLSLDSIDVRTLDGQKNIWNVNWNSEDTITFTKAGVICLFSLVRSTTRCLLGQELPKESFGSGYQAPPVWSSDGKYIAFDSLNGESHCFEIYVYNIDEDDLLPIDTQTCYIPKVVWVD